MTSHQLAAKLLSLPDLPVFHFDPSRAGCDDERDTSLSEPVVQTNDAIEGLPPETIADLKEEGCFTGQFITICGETGADGEAFSDTESVSKRALEDIRGLVAPLAGTDLWTVDEERVFKVVTQALAQYGV